jgi:hypothetical protein
MKPSATIVVSLAFAGLNCADPSPNAGSGLGAGGGPWPPRQIGPISDGGADSNPDGGEQDGGRLDGGCAESDGACGQEDGDCRSQLALHHDSDDKQDSVDHWSIGDHGGVDDLACEGHVQEDQFLYRTTSAVDACDEGFYWMSLRGDFDRIELGQTAPLCYLGRSQFTLNVSHSRLGSLGRVENFNYSAADCSRAYGNLIVEAWDRSPGGTFSLTLDAFLYDAEHDDTIRLVLDAQGSVVDD